MRKLTAILCLTLAVLLGSAGEGLADHNLREIERYCEVEWDGSEGELSCSSRVNDRRLLELRCDVEWDGSEGEFDCRGSHFRDVERRCTADRGGDIDC
jgi:hypothetical protein